ncbi:hypothetical protein GQR58_030468 [Nymphon striatum]|nr:hypothetical protein GQR58_030468 [Nymphon striatum]
MRHLMPNELAQIAGRAGRHMNNGTFGVTGEAPLLDDDVVDAIQDNQFAPVKKLQWRNARLQFGSVGRLIQTLEERTDDPWLTRVRESDDLGALKAVSADAEVAARATDGPSVQLLWDVCRIPDFRGISNAEHAQLLTDIYNFLHQSGRVPDDWLAGRVNRIDAQTATSMRCPNGWHISAHGPTWPSVKAWVGDESHWRDTTRAVEDRLSDALHERLTARFVDRRTSVLLRRLNQKEGLVADVNDKGEVTVEGQFVGKIEGFRFRQDKDASAEEAKTIRAASIQGAGPARLGNLVAGQDAVAFVDDEAGTDVAEKVQRRLQHFIDRKITTAFEPMLKMNADEALEGLAKGFAFRLSENFGVVSRSDVADDVKALEQDARGALRKHGVRFGQFTIFMPLLLKPAPTRLRLVLWSLSKGLQDFPEAPPPGLVTVPTIDGLPDGTYTMSGYRAAGARAIRIDMLERLADKNTRAGFEATADMLSITGMTLEQFANLMEGLGYKAEKGEREKVKAAAPEVATSEATEPAAEAAPAEKVDEAAEVEVFYTITWAPKRSPRPQADKPQRKGPPKGKRGGKPQRDNKAQNFSARPPRKEKAIDPDNPFAAALAGLKKD